MTDQRLRQFAADLLRGSPEYITDARDGVPVGNSVVGSLLSLQHQVPRQVAERIVGEALADLDAEAKGPKRDGDEITLRRSGQSPLRFAGELLAESEGDRHGSREQNRWHDLAVYRTGGSKYVVRIAYRTRWDGELAHDEATVVADARGVEAELRGYDPCAHVTGYPVGPAYEAKQARLLADVRQRYENQVSDLLGEHPEFAEVI